MSPAVVLWLENRLLESSLSQTLSNNSYPILHHPPQSHLPNQDDFLLITDHLPGIRPERTILIVANTSLKALPIHEAYGLVTLHSDVQEIMLCLHALAMERRYVSPSLLQKVEGYPELPLGATGTEPLSRREQEILLLMKQGKTLRQIAEHLFISPNTAERHRASIQQKLNLRGRNCLVRFAARQVA